MNFTIVNKYPKIKDINYFRSEVILKARRVILGFPMFVPEIKLDQLFKEKYKMSLKQTCLYLLTKSKINTNQNTEIIITFPNKEDDKLAAFITYGNLEVRGSKILQAAFS